jgi:AbrB family looped-hinge helix DNA binding protein
MQNRAIWRLQSVMRAKFASFYLAFGMENGMFQCMNLHVQMDPAGRVVLPKKVRQRFRLQGGDTLALEIKDDAIQLRPQRLKSRLQRVNGVLVLVSDISLPEGMDLVAESRDERIEQVIQQANKPQ